MADLPIRDDFYVADKRDSLRKVQGTIQGDREGVPILADDGKPFGVLNEKGMVQSRIDLDEKLSGYAVGTKVLAPDASLGEAIRVALDSGLRWVPVVDDGEAVGYVATQDLFVELVARGEADDESAWDLGREVPVLAEEDDLGRAIEAFRDEAGTVHVLPVVDDNGHISGVLHRRAVIHAEIKGVRSDRSMRDPLRGGEQRSRSDWPVEGLSEAHYESVAPEAKATRVADVVDDFGFAVVEENREPQGVVTGLTGLKALRG